jgi:hypothetical protein
MELPSIARVWQGEIMNALTQPDVPVLVETAARPYFPMVRCHYLSIEYDTPRAGWGISLGGPDDAIPDARARGHHSAAV